MEVIGAYDFTGGQTGRLAGTHFTERQWAELYGFVLESDAQLRSQWPWEPVGDAAVDGFVQVMSADDLLVAIDGTGEVWTAPAPEPTDDLATVQAVTWTALADAPVDADQRLTGLVPVPRSEQLGFKTGVLVNGVESTSAAFVVYDGSGGPTHVEYSNRYPTTSSDGVPRANVATMWGDYLVVGDIEWLADKDAAFSSSNRALYPNTLWIAEPGEPTKWDELSVVFTGVKDGYGEARIVGLEAVDAGLMVLTTAGVYLLRGVPSSFEYEELRPGQDAAGLDAVTWWSATGAATWVNGLGQLWHSDGRQFVRLDDQLELPAVVPADAWAASLGEFVLFGRGGRTFAFRLFSEDGAWTELFAPSGFVGNFQAGPCLYGTAGGRVWRLNRAASPRGAIDGVPQTSRVTSRTFEGGDGHRLSFWRRFGLRAQPEDPAAALTGVTLFAGPALQTGVQSLTVPIESVFGDRAELLVPGPGAALEAAVRFEFEGDVTVEQVSAHYTQSRGSR